MCVVRAVGIGLVALVAAGCQQSKSSNPLSPDIAGPIPGVSITAPKPLEPVVGQTLETTQQPFVFLIENAGSSGVRPLYLQFQLATDAGFQTLVHNADRIDPGPNGRTTYRMTISLDTPGAYYWRSRAFDGANTGPWSAGASFTLAEPVIIETPLPVAPIGQIDTVTPQFVLRNGRISGPAGPVIYRIEVATLPDPGAVAAVLSAGVGSGTTTTVSSGGAAPYATTLYWRAYATNGDDREPAVWPGRPSARRTPRPGAGAVGAGLAVAGRVAAPSAVRGPSTSTRRCRSSVACTTARAPTWAPAHRATAGTGSSRVRWPPCTTATGATTRRARTPTGASRTAAPAGRSRTTSSCDATRGRRGTSSAVPVRAATRSMPTTSVGCRATRTSTPPRGPRCRSRGAGAHATRRT